MAPFGLFALCNGRSDLQRKTVQSPLEFRMMARISGGGTVLAPMTPNPL